MTVQALAATADIDEAVEFLRLHYTETPTRAAQRTASRGSAARSS